MGQKGRKSMKKFGEFICKHKIAILIIAVLLCIPSIYGMMATRVNYDILPDDVLKEIYKEDGTTAILVTFENVIAEDRTLDAIQTLRDITDESCKISGMSATNLDIKDICNSEVIIYVIIAVILCAVILGIALDSYAMPFILLGNIGISVLYNLGTNVVLHEISYITKAISAVLQLGVTMDFGIFLYHSYQHQKETESNNDKAMALAIADTLKSVVGSSLTTIAVAFVVILPFAIYGYTHTESYYNLMSGLPKTLPSVQANDTLADDFDMVSTELVLIDKNIPDENDIIKSYDKNGLMAGEGPLMKDLVEIANHDFNSVNTFSILVIFALMFMVLQSISLPVILIIVIEFAIFINMGIPAYMGHQIWMNKYQVWRKM